MEDDDKKRAEDYRDRLVRGIASHGIDIILRALHLCCFGEDENCDDCKYYNEHDTTCQVIEWIASYGDFPDPDRIPRGRKRPVDDPRAERRSWEYE